jgi:hypothetical protein
MGEEILWELILLLKPRRLVAIGKDAEGALSRFRNGLELAEVRHPSYGGQTDFFKQMRQLYGRSDDTALYEKGRLGFL